jgi:hypothetical protein
MNGLHDNTSILLKDATKKQLDASINWYQEKREEWPKKFDRIMPERWYSNLYACIAERGSRIGK